MTCPHCGSAQTRKNGHRRGKQIYFCKRCSRQFLESYSPKGYSDDVKQICLRMHHNGKSFREIERLTGISHNTVINWVRQAESLGDVDVDVDVEDEGIMVRGKGEGMTLRPEEKLSRRLHPLPPASLQCR